MLDFVCMLLVFFEVIIMIMFEILHPYQAFFEVSNGEKITGKDQQSGKAEWRALEFSEEKRLT